VARSIHWSTSSFMHSQFFNCLRIAGRSSLRTNLVLLLPFRGSYVGSKGRVFVALTTWPTPSTRRHFVSRQPCELLQVSRTYA
jgi:hypothetical protein